jgi:hypothetical protein
MIEDDGRRHKLDAGFMFTGNSQSGATFLRNQHQVSATFLHGSGEKMVAEHTCYNPSRPWQEFGYGSANTESATSQLPAQKNHRQIHATSHHLQSC